MLIRSSRNALRVVRFGDASAAIRTKNSVKRDTSVVSRLNRTSASPLSVPAVASPKSFSGNIFRKIANFFRRPKPVVAQPQLSKIIPEPSEASEAPTKPQSSEAVPPSSMYIPARSNSAVTGSKFIAKVRKLSPQDREAAVLRELENGNIPDFMRQLNEVKLRHRDQSGRVQTARAYVMPDYLAIGSNEDFVRVPMTPQTAQKVADLYGASLPTSKLVDEIHEQSTTKFTPLGLLNHREATETFMLHHQKIENQRGRSPLAALSSGHKKDIVNSVRGHDQPDRVAIYGWHQRDGAPIQPLSTVHHKSYVDYSHGVRLVSNRIIVNGEARTLSQLMRDPNLARLVSSEGVLSNRLPD